MYFDEGFAADEAGLFMLPGYILMAMPDGSGKLREEVKLPGKELRQPWRCWTVLEWSLKTSWKARIARSGYGSASKMSTI